MRFKDGLKVGAKGGHGPIKYTIDKYSPGEIIEFRFTKPKGFHGIHRFEVKPIIKSNLINPINEKTEIIHVIDMKTSVYGSLKWILLFRPLHNALIEDALDKIHNHFSDVKKKSEWNIWVKFLRSVIRPRN
jgi:hypothetical protein